MMNSILSGIAISTAALAAMATGATVQTGLPGITRATNNICLIENHSTAFNIWHAANIKGATLVHLDAHDDCRYVSPERQSILKTLLAEKNYTEIFRQSDIESSFRYKIQPDKFLFDLGNFIYPCIMDGTVSRFYWVIPEKTLEEIDKSHLQTHLRLALKLPELTVTENVPSSFSFGLSNCTVTVTTLGLLPQLPPGALLDIDTDFFVFANVLSETHIMGKLTWNPADVCSLLAVRSPNPSIITISSSISGGYLPVAFRFVSDSCYEYFNSGTYPAYAETLLQTLTEMRSRPGSTPALDAPSNPTFRPAYEHLKGLIAIVNGQDDIGIACIDRAAHLNPAYSKAMLDLAEVFTCQGKIQNARRMIDSFDKFTGCETSQSTAMKVRVYLAENAIDKAEILTRQLLSWDRAPYFLMFEGGILVEKGQIPEAIDIYNEAIRLHPDNASVYYNMGLAFEKQGKISEAVEYYQAALKLKADLAVANENLGYILLRKEKYMEAATHLKTAVAQNPFNVTSLNNLGLALARQGLFLDSIACYSAALRLEPTRAEVHANLAASLIRSGRLDEGIAECRKALELKPLWPEVINLMNKAQKQRID